MVGGLKDAFYDRAATKGRAYSNGPRSLTVGFLGLGCDKEPMGHGPSGKQSDLYRATMELQENGHDLSTVTTSKSVLIESCDEFYQ